MRHETSALEANMATGARIARPTSSGRAGGATRRDSPDCRLLAVSSPVRTRRSADRIPARLVLPMVVAPAEGEAVFRPNDLGAHAEPGSLQRQLDFTGVQAGVPDVRDGPVEKGPCLSPVGLIVVGDLAELARIEVHTGALPP
jgi:hypothetical protein